MHALVVDCWLLTCTEAQYVTLEMEIHAAGQLTSLLFVEASCHLLWELLLAAVGCRHRCCIAAGVPASGLETRHSCLYRACQWVGYQRPQPNLLAVGICCEAMRGRISGRADPHVLAVWRPWCQHVLYWSTGSTLLFLLLCAQNTPDLHRQTVFAVPRFLCAGHVWRQAPSCGACSRIRSCCF